MLETLKSLSSLVDSEISESECVSTYQDNQSPICFATMFVKHFPAIRLISQSYWGITEADKASFCLEEMHRALLGYSPDKGVKFLTYFLACLKNRLRAETQSLSCDKRKADYFLSSEEGELDELPDNGSFLGSELLISIDSTGWTENEKAYCHFFSSHGGHANATDFARSRGISDATVHYIRAALRKKITAVMA